MWWQAVRDSGSVADPEEIGPVPCSGRLVRVKVADDVDPATTLRTVFETSLSFDQAAAFVFYPDDLDVLPVLV